MKFEWDNKKNSANLEKHKFSFEDAELIFKNQTLTFLDNRRDYGEIRFITLGSLMGRIVVLVHTNRGDRVRIISMRKANEREQKIYYERFRKNRQNEG